MSATLDLPPLFELVRLRESADAFARALALAPERGAGTLVQVGRFDLVEFAVVLEPEEPLAAARRALYAGMNALADAVSSHASPEKPVGFGWPDRLLYDGALVGGGRLGWPAGCADDQVPDWLVFGAMLRAAQAGDPGLTPDATSLGEEDVSETDAIVESFARHLMWGFDLWQERGFGAIAGLYLARLPKERAADERRIGPAGELVTANPGVPGEQVRDLAGALAAPSWLDPATRGPRLSLQESVR